MTAGQDTLARQFAEHRSHLLGVAYRLTGTVTDAEDAIQETWLRLSTVEQNRLDGIRDLRAWLTRVTANVSLDRLRSAVVRRERYSGSWLPEPMVTQLDAPKSADPLESVIRDDGVRMAAMVVLDRLTPEQRVAFVLHDAFSVPFDEIAETLGCSPATARQHASRGRRAVADADPPPRAALAEQRALLERFSAALAAGDLPAVIALLHPDITLIGDADGTTQTARRVIHGQDKVARFLIGLAARYGADQLAAAKPILVNGDLGQFFPDLPGDADHPAVVRRVAAFAIRDGRLAGFYDIANPAKLTRLDL